MKKFLLTWLDGRKAVVSGNSIEDACQRAGIGTVCGLDCWEEFQPCKVQVVKGTTFPGTQHACEHVILVLVYKAKDQEAETYVTVNGDFLEPATHGIVRDMPKSPATWEQFRETALEGGDLGEVMDKICYLVDNGWGTCPVEQSEEATVRFDDLNALLSHEVE
jgi:hypothetical protein